MTTENRHDVIVIGGGHAGVEAAWAAANCDAHVALITMDASKIGTMSCNPAIGGLAKGQIVREIDALGGIMGRAADATGIQFRILNASKGPAVQGPRCQSDKYRYAQQVQRLLATRDNVEVIEAIIEDFIVENDRCRGVVFAHAGATRLSGQRPQLRAAAVVLTTGTFMRGLMHTGPQKVEGGRIDEGAAVDISSALSMLGFELGRLKTGTPPRLAAETIEFDTLQLQHGDKHPQPFSDLTPSDQFPMIEQRPCHITHTNEAIHDVILTNLDRAPMYNGQIAPGSSGPRYCPSIEDKVVRFADRKSHHVYLEPESLDTNEIYCNGISTSLPADVQETIVHQMPGCAKAKILRYGYAVEYDMVRPHQIDATCMTKQVEGLFLAGQINGTSGYEEAAGQGLIAGLNAARFARGESLASLRRDQAYIGVMLDDLVTKTPREPYRMFTSRAEFRLLLRSDNAGERLTPLGRDWGLVGDRRWSQYQHRQAALDALRQYAKTHDVDGQPMSKWLCDPQTTADMVEANLDGDPLPPMAHDRRVINHLLADAKYAGYIKRQQDEIDRMAQQERTTLPPNIDYQKVTGLRNEARHVLEQFRPTTVGQAARLAGVTPADIMLVSIALRR